MRPVMTSERRCVMCHVKESVSLDSVIVIIIDILLCAIEA